MCRGSNDCTDGCSTAQPDERIPSPVAIASQQHAGHFLLREHFLTLSQGQQEIILCNPKDLAMRLAWTGSDLHIRSGRQRFDGIPIREVRLGRQGRREKCKQRRKMVEGLRF